MANNIDYIDDFIAESFINYETINNKEKIKFNLSNGVMFLVFK